MTTTHLPPMARSGYARGQHGDEQGAMAQWWSDYLDMLRKGADVVPIKAKGAGK